MKTHQLENVPFVWLDPRLDMPAWLFAGIGRIAAEWSYLESELEETIRVLHDTDVKRARIAVTGMNVRSRLACISSLLQAHGLIDLSIEFAKLTKTISDNRQPERDKIVHGLWSKLNKNWIVIRSSGVRSIPDIGRISRSTLPQQETSSKISISDIRDRIRFARQEVVSFRKRVYALLPPSEHKSPQQLSRHYRRLAHTK
jgi:hypothetical protein